MGLLGTWLTWSNLEEMGRLIESWKRDSEGDAGAKWNSLRCANLCQQHTNPRMLQVRCLPSTQPTVLKHQVQTLPNVTRSLMWLHVTVHHVVELRNDCVLQKENN